MLYMIYMFLEIQPILNLGKVAQEKRTVWSSLTGQGEKHVTYF